MKKIVGNFGLALLSACAILFFSTAAFAGIDVGVIGSMTSGLALLGQRQINSAILAAEEWNAKGGINGEKTKLAIEDSGKSTTQAMTALDRVLAENVCAILGPIYSFQLFAMFPEINKEGVPLLSTSGTRKLTQMGNRWYFRLYPHDGITKRAYTLFAVEELGCTRPALMCVTTEYGKSGYKIIMDVLKSKGIKPVAVTWHEKSDKDMTGQLERIRRAHPSCIISQAHPPDTAQIIRQQYELGINIPHIASSAASMPTVHKLVGKYMEGVYVEAAAIPNYDPDPKIQAWTKKYVKKFRTRPDSFALLYYDTANFLFNAIKAVGPDRKKIRDWLEKNSYKGLAGRYKFDKEHNGAFFAIIVQYHMKNGKAIPTVVKKYDFTPE